MLDCSYSSNRFFSVRVVNSRFECDPRVQQLQPALPDAFSGPLRRRLRGPPSG